MEDMIHQTQLVGKGPRQYWQCSCGEIYPAKDKHPPIEKVLVILFKGTGKYYTEEYWLIPENAIIPYDMLRSKDFRRIGGGAVLIPSQEPWGFPHLFPGVGRSLRLEAN